MTKLFLHEVLVAGAVTFLASVVQLMAAFASQVARSCSRSTDKPTQGCLELVVADNAPDQTARAVSVH